MKKNLAIALFAVASLTACGEAPVQRALIVDGARTSSFEADRRHCIGLAENYEPEAIAEDVVLEATIGGLIGAAEDGLEGALVGAAVGGVIGSIAGPEDIDDERRDILVRCMQNRGHPVVG